VGSLLALAVAACSDPPEVVVPQGPDMGALLAAYEAPSAPLTEASILCTVAAGVQALDVAARLGLCETGASGLPMCEAPEVVMGTLDALRLAEVESALAPASTRQDALTIAGTEFAEEGFMQVVRRCPGWPDDSDPETRGRVDLTAPFSPSGIGPVVWGRLERCHLVQGAVQVDMDADVSVHLGGDVSLADLDEATMTFRLAGTVVREGEEVEFDLDFRVRPEPRFELRLPLEDGHVLLLVEPEAIGFAASNGEWRCDLEGEAFESGTCDSEGGEQLSW